MICHSMGSAVVRYVGPEFRANGQHSWLHCGQSITSDCNAAQQHIPSHINDLLLGDNVYNDRVELPEDEN